MNGHRSGSGVLNLAQLELYSRANGPGLRAVVWVQGCPRRCPGCLNVPFLQHRRAHLVEAERLIEMIAARTHGIEGITLSGGEPFEQPEPCARLLFEARRRGLSTMAFTGYTREELLLAPDPHVREMLDRLDVLVDGPYVAELACDDLWRGSRNQRVLFLTGRYDESAMAEGSAAHEEIRIAADGAAILRTGIVRADLRRVASPPRQIDRGRRT